MPDIKATEELMELLRDLKRIHAKRTGEFVSYENIIEAALDDFDIESMDDYDEWEEDNEN